MDIAYAFWNAHVNKHCIYDVVHHLIWLIRFSLFQPTSPIRAEIDVKLGGTQCNVIMNRLKPLLRLHFSKKKRMVLREETSTLDKPPPTTDTNIIMWTCTFSAPEMTIVLHSISGLPLYHVSVVIIHLALLYCFGFHWQAFFPLLLYNLKEEKKKEVLWGIHTYIQAIYRMTPMLQKYLKSLRKSIND